MSKKKCVLFFMLCLVTIGLMANGGGVDIISAAARSSDPVFRDIKDITLLSEKLYIKLTPEWSNITVKYVLWNNSDRDYLDIDYAFPIDYASSDNPRSTKEGGVSIDNICFVQDGQSLSFDHSEDKFFEDKSLKEDMLIPSDFSLFRRWYYTKVSVKKHSFVSLEVRYSLKNFHFCDSYSPLCIENNACTQRRLLYDLSPASHWGDGIIRDFYVEIDADDLYLSGDIAPKSWIKGRKSEMYDPFRVEVRGLDFTRKENRFVYRARNYDLSKTNALRIDYNTLSISSIDLILGHRMPDNLYTVKASSEQAKYPLSNLMDMNLETAWVPVRGVGEWIEFTFKKPVHDLAGYAMLNGYWKNKDTYYQNNRIKKLKVEIKYPGKDWEDIEDWQDEYEDNFSEEPVYFENMFHHTPYVDFCYSLNKNLPVEKVRFTILELYPGTKYDDTCISEIMLFKMHSGKQ